MEKQGEAAAGRRLWGEEGEDGSWEGVVTGSPLGKAKFTVLEKKKKHYVLLYLFLSESFLLRTERPGGSVRCTVEVGASRGGLA